MGNLIGVICKGPYINALDQDLENVKQVHLDDLKGPRKMADLGIARQICSSGDVDHIENDWFGERWWGKDEYPNKREIMRAGYIEATIQSLAVPDGEPPKPIVTYWIKGLDRFAVQVCATNREIHVFWMTPSPPRPHTQGVELMEEDMIYVSDAAGIEELRAEFPDNFDIEDPKDYPKASPDSPLIQGQRLYSYGPRRDPNP